MSIALYNIVTMSMTSLSDRNFQLHFNFVEPLLDMWSIVDQNIVMQWVTTSFPKKRNQGSLEKCSILDPVQKKYKMSLNNVAGAQKNIRACWKDKVQPKGE